MEKELKNLFQVWQEKIEKKDVDSNDCSIAFDDREYFEEKINENINCLNFLMLEIEPVESDNQELKLLIKVLERLQTELDKNFENYNNVLVERPHKSIFDGLSDFSDEETEDEYQTEIIQQKILNHRIVFYDSDGEIEDDNVNINKI